MNLLSIPLKNLKVKFFKTVILIVVFAIGVTSVVGLQKVSKSVSSALEDKMNKFGANILIYPKSEDVKISYGGIQLGNLSYEVKYLEESETESQIRSIEFDENISAVAPKLLKTTEIRNKTVGVVGVDWEEEIKIKNYWSISGRIPESENEVILGSKIARILNVRAQDSVLLYGKEFRVSGIIQSTGSDEDNLIFMGIQTLQAATNSVNKINFVEVSALCAGCPIDDIVTQISANLPGAEISAVQKIVKQRMSAVDFVNNLAFIMSLVIVLTACFMIALFMYSSVNERKKEIGILRSIGYSKVNIFSIFTFESLIIGMISGLIGYTGGFFLAGKLMGILEIDLKNTFVFTFPEAFLTMLLVAILAGISSMLPSLKAAKITPAEALVSL